MRLSRRALLLLTLTFIAPFAPALAQAELTQKGNLFIRFDGGISPNSLPRNAYAPIAVRIEGTIRVPKGEDPPSLRRIEIALNRGGKLETKGLAVCHRNQIDPATPSEALGACGPSLIGAGGIVARTSFPGQSGAILRGNILLFNGVAKGKEVIFGHVYQRDPAPITRVIVFKVHRTKGTFGTVIVGETPPGLNRNGYLKSIFLQLERRYVLAGKERSYLSARCAAPQGFTAATFPFAKASMFFEDGRMLSSTLTRTCRVSR